MNMLDFVPVNDWYFAPNEQQDAPGFDRLAGFAIVATQPGGIEFVGMVPRFGTTEEPGIPGTCTLLPVSQASGRFVHAHALPEGHPGRMA